MDKARAYRSAIEVQDACNLSGVMFAFCEAMEVVREETRDRGEQDRRNHPIVILFLAKLVEMVPDCEDLTTFGVALDLAKSQANGTGVTR